MAGSAVLRTNLGEAVGFYSIITAATLLGIGIDLSPLDPIKALFWSAVINGFVAMPVMAAIMWVGSRRDQMGRFTVGPLTLALGWVTTAVVAGAALAILIVCRQLEGTLRLAAGRQLSFGLWCLRSTLTQRSCSRL